MIVKEVVQHGSVSFYLHCLIFSTGVYSSDVVAQDRYSLQSKGRDPGDKDSSGVDWGHSEVTNWL